LNETHISDFFAEIGSDISEVFGEAQSDSPGLIFSGLDDQRHDVSFVLVFGEYFGDFLERFCGEDSDLILFVGGAVLEDADEVGEDVLLFVDFAEVGNFGCGDSLEEEHFFIGDVQEFPELMIKYCRILSLLAPALW
jgi:hypothetical protein